MEGRKEVTPSQDEILAKRLVRKSIDAFLSAIEIVNKPTATYRTENFTFNICNAWELVLKAQIIKNDGEDAIYYKGNRDRTINLQNCLDTVFTDVNNPIKKNIELIAKLRNKSTHFITPEYDGIYVTFFQANVLYFVEHIKKEFGVVLSKRLTSNFLTIASDPKQIEDIRMLKKVDTNTFNLFKKEQKNLSHISGIPGMTISFELRMRSVKKDEDLTFKIDSNSDISAQVIKQVLDPSNSHPYRQTDIIKKINIELKKEVINQYSFRCIRIYEKLEESREFYYFHKQSGSKTYSEKAYQLILRNIKNDSDYVHNCVSEYKKSNPRS